MLTVEILEIFVDILIGFCSMYRLNKHTEEVDQQERERTKRVVYSLMYGAGKYEFVKYYLFKPYTCGLI
jgi:hypothetical protein